MSVGCGDEPSERPGKEAVKRHICKRKAEYVGVKTKRQQLCCLAPAVKNHW